MGFREWEKKVLKVSGAEDRIKEIQKAQEREARIQRLRDRAGEGIDPLVFG